MTVRYAVTFEYENRPPQTHRGETTGTSASVCVRRATQDAQRALKPVNWASMNCVLLERLPDATGAQGDSPDEAGFAQGDDIDAAAG